MIVRLYDGSKTFIYPRSPLQTLEDYRHRRAFSESLLYASRRTHRHLPRRAATYFNGRCESKQRRGAELPPAPESIVDFVLGFFPAREQYAWDSSDMGTQVVRRYTMDIIMGRLTGYRRHPITGYKFKPGATSGVFSPDDQMIWLSGEVRQGKQFRGAWAWENVEDIYGHEFSHFIDWYYDFPSSSVGFEEAYIAERYRVDSYSRLTPGEYFATTCWMCRRFPYHARKHIPKTYEWFDAFFEGE